MQLERRAEVAAIVSGMNAGVADAYVRWFDIAKAPVRSIVFKAISETGIWVDQDRRHDIVRMRFLTSPQSHAARGAPTAAPFRGNGPRAASGALPTKASGS